MENQNIAQFRIKEFEQKFGTTTLHLAYHAALPVVLNSEFIHLLRINFFLDPPETLDYIAEFDLLLSPFCHKIGDGLYEIDHEIRDKLLKGLIHTYKNEDRIGEIGELLRQYTYRNMPWSHRPALERAQELTALDALDHQRAILWLEKGIQSIHQSKEIEREWFIVMRLEIKRKRVFEENVVFPIIVEYADGQIIGEFWKRADLLSFKLRTSLIEQEEFVLVYKSIPQGSVVKIFEIHDDEAIDIGEIQDFFTKTIPHEFWKKSNNSDYSSNDLNKKRWSGLKKRRFLREMES